MKANPFYVFRIKRAERWPAAIALAYIVFWNVLVILKYADRFMPETNDYYGLFVRTFHISGFDPVSYAVVSQWDALYNIFRHPLLAFFMYIPNQINQGLMMLTGVNCAQFVVAALLVFCAFYCFLFLLRILHEVIGLGMTDSSLLGALTLSFAYVTVGLSVPDHFSISMFMLVLTLYVAAKKMKSRHPFTIWQTFLFFIITAGISLNNGIKVFLANLFVNGRRFWRPSNLLLAVIVPSALMWGAAQIEWNQFERPKFVARQHRHQRIENIRHDKIAKAFRDTTSLRDSAAVRAGIAEAIAANDSMKAKRRMSKAVFSHQGKPMGQGQFERWTDISTPRMASIVENLMGESVQLHDDHLLEDVLVSRPVIVRYHYAVNYVVEGAIAVLFLLGVWYGRRSRFLWLALSFFAFDMFIHVVLGFGLNEVYIMSPHWLPVITIAIAYLFSHVSKRREAIAPLRVLVLLLTLWLLTWNGALYGSYLCQ